LAPSPKGGFDLTLQTEHGSQEVHLPAGRTAAVKVGDVVERGHTLTDGVIKPQDMAELRGIDHVRAYLTDELQSEYKNQGVGINRKTFETVVKSITNLTQIKNNVPGSGFLPGDIVPLSAVHAHNDTGSSESPVDDAEGLELAQAAGNYPIGHKLNEKEIKMLKAVGIKTVHVKIDLLHHTPVVKGMSLIPLLKKDWMAALGYRNLGKVLTEGASQGWQTDTSGYHPIPAIAHGASFGLGKDGKY
jgi:DNA-directed RNA polymerase subunit beta'